MASASDIAQVRINVNEMDTDPYTDDDIASKIDGLGSVAAASAAIWGEKAGRFSELVDVTEAGASHKFSDLHKNALEMQKYWSGQITGALVSGPVVKVIQRID